jgi:hypothetical protein
MRTHFWHPEHWKKRLGRSCLSDVLSRRLALRTHNLSSRRLKKRLCWRRRSDDSRCRKAMRIHFLHPEHRKKRLGRSRLSDDLSGRMALRTHNLPFESLRKWPVQSMKRYFKVSKDHANSFSASCPSKKATCTKSLKWRIFLANGLRTHNLLSVRLKNHFGKVDETIF